MFHADEGYLAATNELMSLHVSEVTRRGAPMAPAILARLGQVQAAHDALPKLPQVGRVMGLARAPDHEVAREAAAAVAAGVSRGSGPPPPRRAPDPRVGW